MNPLALAVLSVVVGLWSPASQADDLPPPPSAIAMPDTTLYLEPVINGRKTGKVIPVIYRGGHYYLTPQQLAEAGLPVKDKQAKAIAVDQWQQVDVSYSGENQQLLINVPNDWLPAQHFNPQNQEQRIKAQSSLGFLFNYDVYASQTGSTHQPGNLSAWSEQRLFDGFGVIANTGIFRGTINGGDGEQASRYIRYDSQWRYNDDDRMLSYTSGDLTTGSLPWTSAVRLGGLQLARNFATRPDLITYPLPQFSGQASVPTSVDLFINSYKSSSVNVNPGPFTLNTVPFINGAGQATVVTTDALGRQVSTVVPFYVASNLLKAGLSDFSVSTGALRRNYGISSADYGQWVASASGRHGLADWITLEGRAEGAEQLAVGGAGIGIRLGQWGVLNTSYSLSQASDGAFNSDSTYHPPEPLDPLTGRPLTDSQPEPVFQYSSHHGDQTSVGYTYSNQRYSLNAQRILRSAGYGDLAVYKSDFRLSRRSDQLTGSIGLDQYGSIGAGYFDVRDAIGQRTRLVNFSYSLSLWRNLSLYASVNREIGSNGFSSQLQLTIPLNNWGTANVSSTRDNNNRWSERVNYSRAAPTEGGLGWNLSYANGQENSSAYHQADVTWRTRLLETRGGFYGNSGAYTRWGEVSGSLVAMNGGIYATNTISDAFALVSTQGYAGIPVHYENQLIGTTNSQGYLLVPTVTSYYHAKFQIDPLTLPADVAIPQVEQTVSIRQQSGYLVDFPIEKVAAADVKLVDKHGAPLANGSQVAVMGSHQQSYVGWDGMTYLDPVQQHNRLSVIPADGSPPCQAEFSLEKTAGMQSIGPFICQ
ncbi:fimbria/pilus outer membrane usher protein [Serratia sp. L9]|uniref:fimbria/pilus outer membrane usher protein n=1 Tax=Serratia sp. L9 TaxID=3423946 RepID=UPI003D67C404